jgi:hypothetical protein
MRLTVLLVSLAASAVLNAQQPSPGPANNATNQMDMRMMQHMQEMDTMAKSMKSMADVCRMMMEKEMRSAPLKIGAIIGVGSLFLIALILFIVLEIQWIRFWSVRIRTERMKLTGPKSP